MKLKFQRLEINIELVASLFLFFFLLRHNQIFFQYKFLFTTTNLLYESSSIFNAIFDYLIFFFYKLDIFEIVIYALLIIPGYIILNNSYNFENTAITLYFIFFFSPFIIFFYSFDNEFYSILTNKKIFLDQIKLNFLILVLYLNLLCLILFSKIKNRISFKKIDINYSKFKIIIEIIILIFVLSIIFKTFPYINLEDISLKYFLSLGDSYRGIVKNFLGYIYYSLIYVFLPIYYLFNKDKKSLILVILIYFIFFIFFKTKINFLIVFLLLTYEKILFRWSKKIYLNILKIILIYLFISFLFSFILNDFYQIRTSLFFERIFLSQTKNLFLVYDFLTFNEPIKLTHISIFNEYFPYDMNFYDLIKLIYGGGSATSNTYVMDGLASFGLLGMFLPTFLLIIIFKLIDIISNFEKSDYQIIYLIQIVGLLSFPLSTTFVTYGLGIAIFFGMFNIKK